MKRKPNIKFQLILALLLMSISTLAQTTISGRVLDDKGETIVGANIYLDGTYDGASSDLKGVFTFETELSGQVLLKATFIGFKDFLQTIQLNGQPVNIEIVLIEAINRMEAVVITAGSFEAGSENKSEVLRPMDIVTTAGATADISGALNTLPGTQTVGEEGRLFVRGGDGYETTTFIDGMMVLDSYDQRAPNLPTRSRFSPFMFSGTSFSTGGYSAEYGQGLSSALILNTKETATENRSDFSLISVGLEAAHTQVWDNASLAGKIGYFNLDPYYKMIKQDFDWINPPTSYDGNLSFRQKIGKNGMLKSYGKFNASDMTFRYNPFETNSDLIRTNMNNQYGHLNTSYRTTLSEKWMLNSGVSYTHSNNDIKLDQDIVNEQDRGLHMKAVGGFEASERLFLKIGSELISRNDYQVFDDFETGFSNRFDFNENILATFLEGEIYFSNSFMARSGGRMEYNSLNKELSIDPRISLALQTGKKSQVSLAFGTFRQSAPKEMLRIASKLDPEKAAHYILNYQIMKNNRTFRIEGYWKEYTDLITFDPSQPYLSDSYSNEGNGYARGIELFYRDGESLSNMDYWISYSYLDTEREYRDYPNSATPTFSSKHNISIVYKYFMTSLRTQVGLTWSFASGRPYNDPNQDQFNGQLTPSYQDLSANLSYLATPSIIIHASVTNILNRDNIFGYEYRSEPDSQGTYAGRPVTLPAPRFLLLGVFITLTKDGSINQLPNL